MQKIKLHQCVRLLTCFLMLSSIAILRDAHFMGYELKPSVDSVAASSPIVVQADGSIVVSTQSFASDIKGYGGATPLEITLRDGKIEKIKALKNAETPNFFQQVEEALWPQWIGQSIENAETAQINAVSGATLSSTAVNATIRKAMKQVSHSAVQSSHPDSSPFSFSLKWVVTLCVVLLGAIVPLFYKNKIYRTVQLCLNIVVLGFWSGTFLSHSLIVNYLSNGANIVRSLIPLLLFVIAFVYPLLGKKRHYCTWICPLGSLQELAGKCVSRKWNLSPTTIKVLQHFHEALWVILLLLMWSGICFSWMDYELFSAFMFSQASVYVLVAALLFIVLSLFVARPYCRFVCPTGCLLRAANDVYNDKNANHTPLHKKSFK